MTNNFKGGLKMWVVKVKYITNFYKLLEKYVKNIWKFNRKKLKKRLDICIENLYT